MRAEMKLASQLGADTVEFRLDMLAKPPSPADLERLLTDRPLPVIVTYRPVRQGGQYDGDEEQRLEILRRAGELGAEFVDVEMDTPESLRPQSDIILSHHDFDHCPKDLDEIAAGLDASPAAVNKIAFAADSPVDALRALDVIRSCRKPTIGIAMGQAGAISRILARKFGAFGTFASLAGGAASAPGQQTLDELVKLYRWNTIGPQTTVYGVIGSPIAHSMSPAIHNAAFAAAGTDAVYVPLLIQPGKENFNRFMDEALRRPWLSLRGLSVTLPHKENALAYLGAESCDGLTQRIGAVNTVSVGEDGKLTGANTDYAAALDCLCRAMKITREDLAGRFVTVLGAGGVARAIVAALAHYRAEVTIYNRTVQRAERLADEFACRAAPLAEANAADAHVVINCTSVGMHPDAERSPLKRIPKAAQIVFDTVYNPVETRLLRDARSAGCRTVSGLEMFVDQAVGQFEAWTKARAPRDVMRQVVIDGLRQ
jgi:3-dehydroquinate dehydratase/shikimate dehydrogenase